MSYFFLRQTMYTDELIDSQLITRILASQSNSITNVNPIDSNEQPFDELPKRIADMLVMDIWLSVLFCSDGETGTRSPIGKENYKGLIARIHTGAVLPVIDQSQRSIASCQFSLRVESRSCWLYLFLSIQERWLQCIVITIVSVSPGGFLCKSFFIASKSVTALRSLSYDQIFISKKSRYRERERERRAREGHVASASMDTSTMLIRCLQDGCFFPRWTSLHVSRITGQSERPRCSAFIRISTMTDTRIIHTQICVRWHGSFYKLLLSNAIIPPAEYGAIIATLVCDVERESVSDFARRCFAWKFMNLVTWIKKL